VAVAAVAAASALAVSGNSTIRRIAGPSSYSVKPRLSGDGGPATSANFEDVRGLAVDGKGNVYIGDTENFRVRMVNRAGRITTIVRLDVVLKREGGLTPVALATDGHGNLYIADGGSRVFKLSSDGALTTFAGMLEDDGSGDAEGFAGDGGPATAARLNGIRGVAVDPQGNVYIADGENERVRKVGPDGMISTVAGSGSTAHGGFSGDGGPATAARLNEPGSVAVDRKGNLYIADERNERIRKVSPGGMITTIAGTGKRGFCDNAGDGGPATKADLRVPQSVAVDSFGNLYLVASAVRKINPAGKITTIVRKHGYYPGGPLGCTVYANYGPRKRTPVAANSGPASKAHVDARGIAVDGSGSLYVIDWPNRVLKIG
jgi:sugar lactone lactonase YvrE